MNKNPSFLNLKKKKKNLRAFVSLNRSSIAWHGQARQQSNLCACMHTLVLVADQILQLNQVNHVC